MIELVFVLVFTAAGIGAALLALRISGGSGSLRWLALAFCLAALANLAFYAWRIVAGDPAGVGRVAGVGALLAIVIWGYRRFLRAVRRSAGRHGG